MLSPIVLVVDDEPLTAQMVEDCLIDVGFVVKLAHDEAEAAAAIDELGQDLSALITDVRLGTGSGWVVATQARRSAPTLPVVYMTGDSADDWAAQGVPHSILIQKPFVGAQVVTAVTTLMNATSSGAASDT